MALERIWGDSTKYNEAIQKASSNTAKSIMNYLDDRNRPFDIVILPNGAIYGQMLTEMDRSGPEVLQAKEQYTKAFGHEAVKIVRPTVFWCPDYRFEYYGDVVGCASKPNGDLVPITNIMALKGGDFYYQYSTVMFGNTNVFKIPVVRYTKGMMDPWIVLFHELGHVKQYFEGGNSSEECDRNWANKLNNTDQIEADNLKRHENPICNEIRIPIRAHYKHMANGMGNINQSFSSPKKEPALRVANSPAQRFRMDSELLYAAKYNRIHKKGDGYYEK